MIAQVVFDLPLEGVFDYKIPPALEGKAVVGCCVEVTLGFRKATGIIVKMLAHSELDNLKIIRRLIEDAPILDAHQLELGAWLSAYYGCSLGDALFAVLRASQGQTIKVSSVKRNAKPVLHYCPCGRYAEPLKGILAGRLSADQGVLIIVPDQYMLQTVGGYLKKEGLLEGVTLGMRSSVLRSLSGFVSVVIIDEDNTSFKQEQTPKYDARDVLLERSRTEAFELHFISTTPSVELMHMVHLGRLDQRSYPMSTSPSVQVIDLNNYKIMYKNIFSAALISVLEENISKKRPSILVFNHKGSYAMTRCNTCGHILKCVRCQSAMMYSRVRKQYLCRHCSFCLASDTPCPSCKAKDASVWKSFGLGVEQLQKALQDRYPLLKIDVFERGSAGDIGRPDILIATEAIMRFRHQLRVSLIAFLDIDSDISRMDMRSCFRAWSLVGHLRSMAQDKVFVQTRQPQHYVLKSLSADDPKKFYDEEMQMRRELKFTPFAHEIKVHLRGKEETAVRQSAEALHQLLLGDRIPGVNIASPAEDLIAQKRGLFRLHILLQGEDVMGMIAHVKRSLARLRNRHKAIITINVDD